jgi:hypothetical protein
MVNKLILIGDNPFHGVSHLSRERSLLRTGNILDPKHAAELVIASINNGANGFTFTVSKTTLSILCELNKENFSNKIALYPLMPNVNEFVRTAGATGGLPGLAKDIAKKMSSVMDFQLLGNGIRGVICNDPKSLVKAYLKYEYIQLQNIVEKSRKLCITSIMLHEIVTDMALALDMEWLFRAHIELMTKLKLQPGFETRNLPYFVKQFKKWQIDFKGVVIEAPFNSIGFQMCPSKIDCENAIKNAPGSEIIAFSILAAGYVKLSQALDYINALSGINGVAIGISNEKQAKETFQLTAKRFAQEKNE